MKYFSKKIIYPIAVGLVVIIAGVCFKFALFQKRTPPAVALPQIKVGYVISPSAAPFMVAYENGYFKQYGVDVQLVQLKGGREVGLAVSSGKVDLGIAGASHFYSPIEKGAPVKIISPIGESVTTLLVRPDSSIKTLKDFEGKSVASGLKSTKELIFRYALKQEGVDARKVKFADVDIEYQPAALMGKKITDAVVASDDQLERFKELGAVVLPYWQEKKYDRGELNQSVIAANVDWLNNNEKSVSAFIQAITQGHDFMIKNLDQAAVLVTGHIKKGSEGAISLQPEEFKKVVEEGRMVFAIWADPAPVAGLAEISYELGSLSRKLTLDDLYDFRFRDLLQAAQIKIYGSSTN